MIHIPMIIRLIMLIVTLSVDAQLEKLKMILGNIPSILG